MKEPHVDADQICKHIKYTRHWLDKANDDFQEKRFASGGIVLNLARAELTAAWEELMQLKTQVTKNLPRKARTHWKPLSSVGLLAAGFFIALFITRMTNAPIPNAQRTTDAPAAIHEVIPVISEEPETVHPSSVEISAAPAETSVVPVQPESVAPTGTPTPSRKHTHRFTAKPAPESAPTAAAEPTPVKTIEEPATLPYTSVGHPAPAADEPAAKSLENSDIIDLFNTAQKTLHK